jgi:hypothetical protein
MNFNSRDERGMYAPADCRSTKGVSTNRTSRCVDIGRRRVNGCRCRGCFGARQFNVDHHDDCGTRANDHDDGRTRTNDHNDCGTRANDHDDCGTRANDHDNGSTRTNHDNGAGDGFDNRTRDGYDVAIWNDQVR